MKRQSTKIPKDIHVMTNFLKVLCFCLVMTAATLVSAQEPKPTQALDPGVLDGYKYTNKYFGLSVAMPDNWVIVSAPRRAEITDESRKMLAGDQAKKDQIEESFQRSTILLSLTKLPAGEPNNASFMLIAERVPSPKVKTGADVIDLMRNAMKGTNVNIEFLGEVKTENIGGAEFSSVTLKNVSPLGTYMQKVYVTVKNGYGIEFFYTYLDDADLGALDTTIKSIKVM
jgi:hypothetical protein